MEKKVEIIGANTLIDVLNYENVPAKIDTGADSSAIWASNISMSKDGVLKFKLFNKKSPLFKDEFIQTTNYSVSKIRSSNGAEEIRYRVPLLTRIGSKKVRVRFTLASREVQKFPVLIGRRTLRNKFIVDVSKHAIEPKKAEKTSILNRELKPDPYAFHQKYINIKLKD